MVSLFKFLNNQQKKCQTEKLKVWSWSFLHLLLIVHFYNKMCTFKKSQNQSRNHESLLLLATVVAIRQNFWLCSAVVNYRTPMCLLSVKTMELKLKLMGNGFASIKSCHSIPIPPISMIGHAWFIRW